MGTTVTRITALFCPSKHAELRRKIAMNHNILKFRTIVVATDLNYPASEVLRYAQVMARMYQSTLVVVHVIDPLAYAFPEGAPLFLTANQAAAAELKKIEEETMALGVSVHSVMESGSGCDRILQTMKDHKADLLVIGNTRQNRRRTGCIGYRRTATSSQVTLSHPDHLARRCEVSAVGRLLGPRSRGNRFFPCFRPRPAMCAPVGSQATSTSACSRRRSTVRLRALPGATALSRTIQ
jgi:nucleotide-binding universal stress UspA family protein